MENLGLKYKDNGGKRTGVGGERFLEYNASLTLKQKRKGLDKRELRLQCSPEKSVGQPKGSPSTKTATKEAMLLLTVPCPAMPCHWLEHPPKEGDLIGYCSRFEGVAAGGCPHQLFCLQRKFLKDNLRSK